MSHNRNNCWNAVRNRLNPGQDRGRRRNPRYAPESLESRLSPSSLGPDAAVPAQVSNHVPFPDPIDYPEDIPPYEPPIPPGGPSTPK